MSQRTIKATRRQLKRAMGEGAIGVIDAHTHSVQVMQLKISALESKLAEQMERLRCLGLSYDVTTDACEITATKRIRAEVVAELAFMRSAHEAVIDQVQRIATDAYRLASTTANMTLWQRLRWIVRGL